jgi:hypothetical protein
MSRLVVAFLAIALGGLAALAPASASAQAGTPIEATNAAGEKILLHPDGRWEYADPAKRAATPRPSGATAGAPAPTPPAATTAGTAGNAGAAARPAAPAAGTPSTGSTQGGWLFGRRVPEGDPDYNRGSLNPKMR